MENAAAAIIHWGLPTSKSFFQAALLPLTLDARPPNGLKSAASFEG
jgi:hypothetical protein